MLADNNNLFFGIDDTLQSASESAKLAKKVDNEQEEKQAATVINYASSVGCRQAVWMRPMSVSLKKKLEAQGYSVNPMKWSANPCQMFLIEW